MSSINNRTTHISPPKKRGFYSGRVTFWRHFVVRAIYLAVDLVLLLPLLALTLVSRFFPRPIDVGIGPLPSIASRYHKQSLEQYGYRCETFVYHTWYITSDFDLNISRFCPRAFGPYATYIVCLFRYRCIYTYFNGGPLGFTTLLARCEPFLFNLAGIKTLVMPFGADIHVLTRSKNLIMVDAFAKDYPGFRHQRRRTAALIDIWTHGADYIISGCDWVDYMYYWDTLMLSQFAIDTDAFAVKAPAAAGDLDEPCKPLRLIHAPNHRALKGTAQILQAVEELKAEGVAIEMTIVEGIPNDQIPALLSAADVVVDQLVLGWYAMFAMEAMALGKPVVCHIRPQYRDLYTAAGLIAREELPLIDSSLFSIKETLRDLALRPRSELREIGRRSRDFVVKHHSLAVIGEKFDLINRQLGIPASLQKSSKP